MEWLKEWAVPLSAGAMFLLALAAFWAIWQTRSTQKTEKREGLLNEIIEWALDITKCEVPIGTVSIASVIDKEMDRKILSAHLSELASRCAEMILRGRYISSIVSNSKLGQELQQAVVELINHLEIRINLLGKCNDAVDSNIFDKFDQARSEARQHWLKQIRETIYTVIEEATKIKTKDMG